MSHKKSREFHRLTGSFRADRHANGKLQYAPASGTPPRWLTKAAKSEWKRVVPTLLEQGLLTEPDVAVLGSYCMAVAGYLECVRLIDEQGAVLTIESQTRTGRTSKPIKNPAVQLMFDYSREMRTCAAKFGFTPYDRERIEGSEPPDDDDPFEHFLRGTDSAPAIKSQEPSAAVPGVAVTHGDALGPFIKFPEEPKFDELRREFEAMSPEEFANFRQDYYEAATHCVFGLNVYGQMISPHGTSVYGVPKLRPEDD